MVTLTLPIPILPPRGPSPTLRLPLTMTALLPMMIPRQTAPLRRRTTIVHHPNRIQIPLLSTPTAQPAIHLCLGGWRTGRVADGKRAEGGV